MEWNTITYPRPLRPGNTVGITALSSGVEVPVQQARLDLVLAQWRKRGFKMLEGQCLRKDHKQISAPAKERAAEFMKFWTDPEIKAILPPWGGERLIQILESVDFETIARTGAPKWVLGFSDISTMLFALTLQTGIATAHGAVFMELIENQAEDLTNKYLHFLSLETGQSFTQISFTKFEKKRRSFEEDVAVPFNLEQPVEWKSLQNRQEVHFQGRLIGGCLDTLMHLVGTPYGALPAFVQKFTGQDGVILYLENCELNPSAVARALTQLKYAGWFENLNGLIIGRSAAAEPEAKDALTEKEAIESVLGDATMPILLDADIGHKPPQMLLINGAFAEIRFEQMQSADPSKTRSKAEIAQTLR